MTTRDLTRIERRFTASVSDPDLEERALPFIASDGTVDRWGDSIDPNGWDLRNFKRNPVLLWMHNQQLGAIGSIDVKGEHALRVENGQLKARARFATEDQSEPMARLKLWEQVKAGLLRAFSISARPTAPPEPLLDKKGAPTGGYRFPKVELLEISLVTVPGNANALALARSFGVNESDLSQVFEGARQPEILRTYYDTLRASVPGAFTPRQA